MPRILLGVSGGIAAYKALELIRLATAAGHAVRVIQTPASARFVGPASFEALTGAPVLIDPFQADPARGAFPGEVEGSHQPISHLELAAKADLYLIAPASANTIAKLACGFADTLLCSCVLAARCPVLVAPAMNDRMYSHPATQANLQALADRGVVVIEPGEGRLASVGEHGIGRLAEPAELLACCERHLSPRSRPDNRSLPGTGLHPGPGKHSQPWAGLRVLITAGGTREPIDGVRFIGNSSSGRMGIALAEAALARGAEVRLIAANIELPLPAGVSCRQASTAAEMMSACRQELPGCDVLLMAAAVADFRPASAVEGKIAKRKAGNLTLELTPTDDVLSALRPSRSPGQTIVGFAAEHGSGGEQRAVQKLDGKGLDAVVLNDVSRDDIAFSSGENEVTILSAAGRAHVPKASKREVAEAILDVVDRLRAAPPAPPGVNPPAPAGVNPPAAAGDGPALE